MALATSAQADVQLTTSVGTTGLGLHGSFPIAQRLNARIGGNFLNYSRSGSTTDANYQFEMALRTADLLLDFHPAASGFRVTTGVVLNGNKVQAAGRPSASGTYTFNGRTYSAAEVGAVEGSVDFRRVAPYLGIGWGSAPGASGKGWSLAADLGAIFQGSPRSRLASTGCTAPEPTCTRFAQDVAQENRALADELDQFKVYPVVRVGIAYRF